MLRMTIWKKKYTEIKPSQKELTLICDKTWFSPNSLNIFLYLSKGWMKENNQIVQWKLHPIHIWVLNGPMNVRGYGTFVGRSTRWFLSELPSIRRRRKSGVYIDLDWCPRGWTLLGPLDTGPSWYSNTLVYVSLCLNEKHVLLLNLPLWGGIMIGFDFLGHLSH